MPCSHRQNTYYGVVAELDLHFVGGPRAYAPAGQLYIMSLYHPTTSTVTYSRGGLSGHQSPTELSPALWNGDWTCNLGTSTWLELNLWQTLQWMGQCSNHLATPARTKFLIFKIYHLTNFIQKLVTRISRKLWTIHFLIQFKSL